MDEESAITATCQIGYLDTGDVFRIAGIAAIADHAIGGPANLVSVFATGFIEGLSSAQNQNTLLRPAT